MHLGFVCVQFYYTIVAVIWTLKITITLFSTLFLDPLRQYKIYKHHCPLPMASSGEADDKSTVPSQTCCSQQLAERAMDVCSILIVLWVYICFIFSLSLDPGRKREAQSFPREKIFLQEDRTCSLWVIQFLSNTSQSLAPQAFPSPSPSVFFTFHSSCIFFLVIPPKCI